MFSGIVEGLCEVKKCSRNGENLTIGIDLQRLFRGVRIGDSIAVNGTCLTVTKLEKGLAYFEAIQETLDKTNLGQLTKGAKVNIERSLRLSSRISGHLVTGHIDGIGKIVKKESGRDSTKMWISCPMELVSMMIPKGSVSVDGISLTLVDVLKERFSVCLIPHTLSVTTLGFKRMSDTVNIEVDMIGKYVKKLLGQMGS